MQIGAMRIEPCFGAAQIRADSFNQPPEPARMIQLDQMSNFMCREILEDEGRRKNQSPGVGQHPRGRARAPSACLVAHRDTSDLHPEHPCRLSARCFEITLGFALEIIMHAARKMRSFTGNAQKPSALLHLDPDRATRAASMIDAVVEPPQRHHRAMCKRSGFRKTTQPSRNPRAVFPGKFPCLFQTAAWRHGQHDFAADRVDTQRIAPRLGMAAYAHRIDLALEINRNGRRLAGAAKEQSAQRYGHF